MGTTTARAVLRSYHRDDDDGDSVKRERRYGWFGGSDGGSDGGDKHAAGTMHAGHFISRRR
jgi:hypothetical protein